MAEKTVSIEGRIHLLVPGYYTFVMPRHYRNFPLRLTPKTMLLPLVFLFCAGLGGATTLQQAFFEHYFFQAETWWIPFLSLFIYNMSLAFYLKPAFRLAAHTKLPPADALELARVTLRRFRHLPWFTIGLSIALLFMVDAQVVMGQNIPGAMSLSSLLKVLVNLGSGLFLGVLMHFFLENALFEVKKQVKSLAPDLPQPYQSLYFKIFLALIAITIHLVILTVATLPSFITVERPALAALVVPQAPLATPDARHNGTLQWMKKNADVLFNAAQYGAKDVLDIFIVQMLLYLGFIVLMLREVRLLIQRPLETIQGRLKDLNSGKPEDLSTIDVVQNDEFAAVFGEINRLIDTQKTALTASQERLSYIVTRAADPIVVFDAQGNLHLFNPAAEEFFGYTEAEAQKASFAQLVDMPEDVAFACRKDALPLIRYLLEESESRSRQLGIHKDGSRRPFESNISTTQTAEGPMFTAVLRDISEQIALEETLTKAKVAAENANRMKSEFLANMSHELRTPLNAVLGFTQLLDNDKNLTDGQREKIRTISHSGEHLLDLINDILDISKIEAGKIEMHETAFDLHVFVDDIRDMFSLKAKKKGLNLDVEVLEGLPQYVKGDLGKLRQVIINLVGNAVKFTSEGGVGLVVGLDGGRVRFSVNDSGRGIPANEIEAILQPFVQSSLTDHEGGTGLGLAISSRFVEMMGGHLEVVSEVDKGSTFSFDVPMMETQERPEAEEGEIKAAAIKAGTSVLALIVDDKLTNRLILKEMLEGVGFSTMEAENGQEALERTLEYRPRLVFMDIKMPLMDGYEAVTRLKADPATRAVPVFALTASAFKHDEQRIRDSGFDGFLAKPFKQSSLFRLIKEKTDVELEYETAAPTSDSGPTGPVDYQKAAARLGPGGLATLEEVALINDFAAVRKLADEWVDLPEFSRVLKTLAASFDESGLQREIDNLKAHKDVST